MTDNDLIEAAVRVRERSHSPYSCFAVGAALLTSSGKVFTGCNIENQSYRLTICAEQAAIASAVSAGERHFTKIAVVTGLNPPSPPCGACRQTLAEFNKGLEIIMANPEGAHETVSLADLLPRPFDDLEDQGAV